MVKRDSSLQRTHFHCFRVQWRRALHHSGRCLALHVVILGLCAAARPWKLISWSSWRTALVLMLLPEAVRNSVGSVATEDRRFLRASALGGPVLWACVAYHFAAKPLLLLDVSTSQNQPLQLTGGQLQQGRHLTDMLERRHPMTVLRWKSLSSSVWAILLPMFKCLSMEI